MAEHEQTRNVSPLAMELREWLRAPTTLVHASRVTEFGQNPLLLSLFPKAKKNHFLFAGAILVVVRHLVTSYAGKLGLWLVARLLP